MADFRDMARIQGGFDHPTLPDQLWGPSDAARFLRVSTRTLRRLIYFRDLPCLRIGSRLRFVPTDVLTWARQRKEG